MFTDNFTENLAHAHAVDTRPSLHIIEGLGTRLTHACCEIYLQFKSLHGWVMYNYKPIITPHQHACGKRSTSLECNDPCFASIISMCLHA